MEEELDEGDISKVRILESLRINIGKKMFGVPVVAYSTEWLEYECVRTCGERGRVVWPRGPCTPLASRAGSTLPIVLLWIAAPV